MNSFAEYLPILTTILAAIFTWEIYRHYKKKRTKYLLWWTIGVLNFGLGTFAEGMNLLLGWSELNLKLWYISGALLGGFTLAQGTVYLLMSEKFGDISTVLWSIFLGIAIVCVILTPISLPEGFEGKLNGSVFQWKWVRYFSPFPNTYALIFSFGGAVYSAIKYFRQTDKQVRFKGNVYISLGTLLPGIGGIYTKMGHVNVLFVTELIGLFLIYWGYRMIKLSKH
jgi:hypothetical protein